MVTRGEETKLSCSFAPREPPVKGAVSWLRVESRDNVSSTQVISLKGRFSLSFPKTFLSEGDGSLIISNVSWEDGGIYICKVLIWEKEQEQGNGTQLIVYAHPSHPEIYLQVATQTEPELTLACKTSGYYPPPVHISWYSRETALPASEVLEIWEPEHGVFHCTRNLILPSSLRANVINFMCSVQHVSLSEPLRINYTYSPIESRLTGYQLVEYLNIMKLSLLIGLTLSMFFTDTFFWIQPLRVMRPSLQQDFLISINRASSLDAADCLNNNDALCAKQAFS
ncbi:natural cytotoxicity triggering receptor 3 ligand 1-like [Pelobates fuscus]|uniref:natural cytotoxicity triggering receptor 3 ligand 1-like n=1 Tax=Pelobates fuscus TaxID=191477 RepID=UPI002FE4A4B8